MGLAIAAPVGHNHSMDVIPLDRMVKAFVDALQADDRIAIRHRVFAAGCLGAALTAVVVAAVQTWRARDEADVLAEVRHLDGAVQALHEDLDQVRAASERERAASDAALHAARTALEVTRFERDELRAQLDEAHRR